MLPKVSVIIPAFNTAHLIAETIQSILSQDYPDIEVIVVDDASTDATAEVVRSFGQKVQYILQPKLGVCAARNRGLAAATGAYLFFFDSDDLMGAGVIRAAVHLLEKERHYDVVYGFIAHFEVKDGRVDQHPLNKRPVVSGSLLPELIRGNHLTPGQYMIRRKCYESVGGFTPGIEYIADWDYVLRLAQKHQFVFSPIMFINRRLHAAMWTRAKKKDDIYELRKIVLKGVFGSEAEAIEKKYVTRPVLADWYKSFGLNYADTGDWLDARKYLAKSLQAWPWQFKLWLWFFVDGFKQLLGQRRKAELIRRDC